MKSEVVATVEVGGFVVEHEELVPDENRVERLAEYACLLNPKKVD